MVKWKTEWKALAVMGAVFGAFFWLPVGWGQFDNAVGEALHLASWYAREHVLLCLVPAFFIAGAIGVFVSQASVMKYLGPRANKVLAYGGRQRVGLDPGGLLLHGAAAVCGHLADGGGAGAGVCVPVFRPGHQRPGHHPHRPHAGAGAGHRPGGRGGRLLVVIGLLMHLIYRKEELAKADDQMHLPPPQVTRPLWQNAVFFALLVGMLVFANWGAPAEPGGLWAGIYSVKWLITGGAAIGLGLVLAAWLALEWWKVAAASAPVALLAAVFPGRPVLAFAAGAVGLSVITSTQKGQAGEWFSASWGFAKQILPLLLAGVLVAGFLLGRPGHEGMIPRQVRRDACRRQPQQVPGDHRLGRGGFEQFARAVWPVWTNFFASVFGAFMYFATLTEVPILQGLIGAGMGKGPALALLLAGPAVSLPSMLVLAGIMGVRKTVVYVSLVVVMATITGMGYGAFF